MDTDAGWSSSVARWAHNPEVAGSNPVPATRSTSGPSAHAGGPFVCVLTHKQSPGLYTCIHSGALRICLFRPAGRPPGDRAVIGFAINRGIVRHIPWSCPVWTAPLSGYFQCAIMNLAHAGEQTLPSPTIARWRRSFFPHAWHSSRPGCPPVTQWRAPRTALCSVIFEPRKRPIVPLAIRSGGRFRRPLTLMVRRKWSQVATFSQNVPVRSNAPSYDGDYVTEGDSDRAVGLGRTWRDWSMIGVSGHAGRVNSTVALLRTA